jgi:hypothetical protein
MEVLCCISDSLRFPLFLGWHIKTEINCIEKKNNTTKKPIVKAHCHPSKLVGTNTGEIEYPISDDPAHLYQHYSKVFLSTSPLSLKFLVDNVSVHFVAP